MKFAQGSRVAAGKDEKFNDMKGKKTVFSQAALIDLKTYFAVETLINDQLA